MDFLIISSAPSGFQYVLVFTDHFTKFAVVVPTIDHFTTYAAVSTKDHTPTITANLFWEHLFQPYGYTKWTKARTLSP